MNKDTNQEIQLLINSIREALINRSAIHLPTLKNIQKEFNPKISQIYITLFQEGNKLLRWGSKRETFEKTIIRVVLKLNENMKLNDFALEDGSKCRIMFEMVTSEKEVDIRRLTVLKFNENRFEPGLYGLKYSYQGNLRYFMPTDAITHSIMSVKQVLNFMSKKTPIARQTNKIIERVHLMRREPIEYKLIESIAYISYENSVIKLYRGYPENVPFDKGIVYESMLKSVDWMMDNMYDDGRFLYYYDGIKDSVVDFAHPNMKNPLYNNILRHCGGTVTLLRAYELTKDKKYLSAAKRSIDFYISTFKTHEVDERFACFPFFNRKSKLGGAGIGLIAMMHYYKMSGDKSYNKYITGLVRHILSRIDSDGEMIGYYIHPLVNNGKPIINPTGKLKEELFSFYYPGEALLGLAMYYRSFNRIPKDFKAKIAQKSELALDFLIHERPVKYPHLFPELPADAWLMQAIEEWVKVDSLKKESYIQFVFDDTYTMIEKMYTKDNTSSTTRDYIGGFFYNYGDHVYHDGSRCEGIIAAYNLAKYLKRDEEAEKIMQAMLLSAKGLMHTLHTKESTFAHKYPQKSIDSFRFKLTRQWVRVDSVQHTACFFARLYNEMK